MADPNMTKEGVSVSAGQLWRDLDYRQAGRVVQVITVNDGKATVARYSALRGASSVTTKLSVKRMHKHSTGWELVGTAGVDVPGEGKP